MNRTRSLYPAPEPTEEEIQHASYLLWIENGRPEGRDLEHWLAAKELLCHHHGRSNPPQHRVRHAVGPSKTAQS